MKTVTKTFNVYEFKELSDNVQINLLEEHHEINLFDGFDDVILDNEKEKLENVGFSDVNISYSGFYSHRDGASFTCGNVDFFKFNNVYNVLTDKRILKLIENGFITIELSVYRSSLIYVHERSVSFEYDYYFDIISIADRHKNILNVLDSMESKMATVLIDINLNIFSSLKDYYVYLTSDDQVGEAIANNYLFLEDGTIYESI